ncbi:polysaccharide biosynthesis/export family protein [Ferruginibacter sp.]|nr:polysaccharide biosynthesis/export family protein [Ferruginibacter sp.]
MGTRFFFVILAICLLFFVSCTTTKNISYFQSQQDTTFTPTTGIIEAPFQKNDILNITISSLSKTASADFNSNDLNFKGYLINSDGNIVLPTLGSLAAAGLTKKQLKENITKAILATKLLLEPIVEIRHLNFEVTVLGEVANPSVINVPSEQISLVKALGLAGDLTIYGKRDNILLIREEGGKRTTRHININALDFLNSPYYYLKPNDVIYVEPNKAKIATTSRSQQIIPVVLSGISILVLVLDRVIQ